MAFPPQMAIGQAELNDLVLNVLRAVDKDATNVITPNKPFWNKIRSTGDMIETHDPNIHGIVERLLYSTPEQIITLSRSADNKDIQYDTPEVETEARYDFMLDMTWLAMGTFERLNTMGKTVIVNHILRKKRALEIGQKNALNDRLWNGRVNGNEVMFGLNTVLNRTTMSTNPAMGDIGGIDTTDTGADFWRPNVRAFGGAYKVIESGNTRTSLLASGANSLLKLWQDCSDNDSDGSGHQEDATKGGSEEGEPDFLLCNDVLYQQILDLIDTRLGFQNKSEDFQLGISRPFFRTAEIFYDSKVPTLVATEGQGYFLNTNSVKFVFANGLERSWGDMEPIPGKTGHGWPMMTEYSIIWNDLRKNGLIHDVQAV